MKILITGKHAEVGERDRDYIQKKLRKFSRYLQPDAQVYVELSRSTAKKSSQREIVQVTCRNNGTLVRSEERADSIAAAMDSVADKLLRQLKRNKDKRTTKKRRTSMPVGEILAPVEQADEQWPTVARVKRFRTNPMTEAEAIDQMENLGHVFFGFFNRETGELNVIYKRQDGNFGRIEYEPSESL